MEKEDLKFIYNTVIHQTDKIDTKAYFLLFLQVALITNFFIRIKDLNFSDIFIVIISTITSILIILTLIFMIMAIWPGFSSKGSRAMESIIYFQDILNSFEKDKNKLIEKYKKCDMEEFSNDLIIQILNISHLVAKKYRNIRKSIIFLILQAGFSITLFFLSYQK